MNQIEKIKPRVIYVESLINKKSNKVLPFIFQLILLFICLLGFLYCVATSLGMPFGPGRLSLMTFPCLLVCALFTINKKVYIGFISAFAAACAYILLFVNSLREYILDSFSFCYNLTIQRVIDEGYTNYKSAITRDITDKLSNQEYTVHCFYCVIIVLIVLFCVISTSSMIKRSLILVCVLPCFVVLTPSLFYGSVPSGTAFALFLSGIIGCYAERIAYGLYTFRKKASADDAASKIKLKNHAFLASVNGVFISLAVLVLSTVVISTVYSKDVPQVAKVRDVIDRISMKFMNEMFYEQYESPEGAIGGLLDGNILELKTPKFRELPVMTVTTKTNNTLYLRGWIGSDLQQNGWEVLDESDTLNYKYKVSNSFDQYTQFYRYTKFMSKSEIARSSDPENTVKLGFVYDTVTVKAKFTKSLMLFVPISGMDGNVIGKYRGITTVGDTINFFKDTRPGSNTYKIDCLLTNFSDRDFYNDFKEKQKEYMSMASLITTKKVGLNDEEQFMYDERKYREYVDATYMNVPEKTGFLKNLAQTVTKNYSNDFDKALAVERYFKTNYTYAQKFTSVDGTAVDKVKYMIDKSKTGYCTYFATAMTVMMRSMGIPARYVSGYHSMTVTDTGESKYVRNILDNNYHAWVEVYFDGIGWLTFDPTPGSGDEKLTRDYDYLDDRSDEENHDTDNEPQDIPDEAFEQDMPDSDNSDAPVGNEMLIPDESLPTWLIAIIICVFGSVLIVGICAVVVVLINRRFNRYRASLDVLPPTDKVRSIYPNILRLLSMLGYSFSPGETVREFASRVDRAYKSSVALMSIIGCMEMTQFSRNTLDDAKAALVVDYFDNLTVSALYSMNVFKKYYYMITINRRSKL